MFFLFRSHKFALNFNFIECNTMRSKKKNTIKNFSQVSALELKRITAIFIMISRIQKPVAFCCWHHKYTQHVMSLSHHARGEQRIEPIFFSPVFLNTKKTKSNFYRKKVSVADKTCLHIVNGIQLVLVNLKLILSNALH